MTQQLPPPPQGFTAQQPQAQSSQSLPPPPAGFTDQGSVSFNQNQPLQAGVSSALQSQAPVLGNIVSGVLGLGRRTEETQQTPELITAPAKDVGMKLGLNLALNFDPEEIEQIALNEFGPEAIRKDDQGNTFLTVEGQEYILNKPGLSKQDLGATIGNAISFLPTAKLAALGQTVAKRIGIGAIGSGATQTAIEAGQAATGGEFDASEVLAATAFGGLGEAPAAVMQTRKLAGDAAKLIPQVSDEQAAAAARVKEETGVILRPSQATNVEQDKLIDVVLSRDPETGPAFTENLRQQSGDAYEAVMATLDELATSDDAARAALDVRATSKEALAAARKVRTQQTKPLFTTAFENANNANQILDAQPVLDMLAEQIDTASGPIRRQLVSLRNIVAQASAPSSKGSNVQKLWNAKKAIFNLADQLKEQSTTKKLDKNFEGVLNDAWSSIRDIALNEVDGLQAANDLFIELSPAFDLVEESIGNVANIPDGKLASVRRKLFDWAEFNASPESVRQAKRVIQGANPEAWNAILRNKLQQDLAEVGVETVSDAMDANFNFIQQFWSKALKGRDKAMMMQSLDGEARKNFNAIADAFQRTRLKPTQSATKQLANIEQSLAGGNGVPEAIDSILNPSSSGIFKKIFGSPQVKDRNVKILSQIMLDPNWMDRMAEIRKLGMNTPEGGAAFAQLFREALTGSDDQ